MTLLVRDEEDVLDAHLRYHFAAGVDFVIATDNLSVDRTPEILRAYERERRLRLIEERGDNYDQSKWVTRMARLAATEYGADWVINGDADEFWWAETGDLKATLAAVPRGEVAVSVLRTNFVPRPPSAEPFFRSMTIRERVSLAEGTSGKLLRDKVCHRAFPDVDVGTGTHRVYRRRFLRRQRLSSVAAPIAIFHFPIRSYAQLENKVAKGGAAAARNPAMWDVWPAMRKLYELLERGELAAYYEGLVQDDAAVTAGIADGTLVVDERLRRVLDEISG